MAAKPYKSLKSVISSLSISLFCLLGLAACTLLQTTEKDGPPRHFDPNRIIPVTPQAEPKARYGNHTPYQVFGKTYHVMNSANGYEVEGIASWYGAKFHGKRTSSWEPYDLNAMTAAHKALPLPTYVEVTNLENNRSAIVKVNDRGPFHDDRVIDLSYAAAFQLGFAEQGTARVKVRAITFETLPASNVLKTASATPTPIPSVATQNQETQAQTATDEGTTLASRITEVEGEHQVRLFVQAGAFTTQTPAQKLKQELEAITTLPILVTQRDSYQQANPMIQSNPANPLHRVRIGPLVSEEQAQLLMEVIETQQIANPLLIWR